MRSLSTPRARSLASGLAILTVLSLGAFRELEAQGCSGSSCTVQISMPVNDVLRLTIGSNSSALGTPNETNFTAGFRDLTGAATSITVKANRAWRVSLQGATTKFSYTGSLTNPQKNASDLLWATTQGGLATTTNNMGTSSSIAGTATASSASSIFFRTLWSFTKDVPGTYSLVVNLTISAP